MAQTPACHFRWVHANHRPSTPKPLALWCFPPARSGLTGRGWEPGGISAGGGKHSWTVHHKVSPAKRRTSLYIHGRTAPSVSVSPALTCGDWPPVTRMCRQLSPIPRMGDLLRSIFARPTRWSRCLASHVMGSSMACAGPVNTPTGRAP